MQIKEKLSILDVVQPYVKLTRAGKYWKGLCPVHKEKTPSFHVSPERGTFHCFGCGIGGDIFGFVEQMEGVDFKGAMKILAEKAGVEIVYAGGQGGKEAKERLERLREAMARAEAHYARALTEDSPAYAYALSRGLASKTIRGWHLGVAKDDWRDLFETLTKDGFTTEELLAAGLIKEADGKRGTYYDRFRNRLMFPIKDAAGRTVAFTGRALGKDEQAKYLNSPETELFKKSQILFAMDRAKDAIRTRGFALLMEGQLDVIHAHQAGFENAIALSGTALSVEHLSLLMRYSENLMLCLDSDQAGIAATWKHAMAALRSGMRVKAVRLPQENDPADLISENPKEFAKRVGDAKPIAEFFLALLGEKEADSHRLLLQAERLVLPLIRAIRSPLEQEHFIGETARALSSTPEAVRAAMKHAAGSDESAARSVTKAEKPAAERITDDVILRAIVESYPDTLLANRVKSEYTRIVGAPMIEGGSAENVLFETGILFGESPSEHAADDTLKRFERATLERSYADALSRMRAAERSQDATAMKQAEETCATIAKAIARL